MKLLLSSNVMQCATLQSDLSAATRALLLTTLGRVGSDVSRQREAAASKIGTSWATSTEQLPEHADNTCLLGGMQKLIRRRIISKSTA